MGRCKLYFCYFYQESLKKVLQEKLEAIQKLTEIEVCVFKFVIVIHVHLYSSGPSSKHN